MVFRLWQLCSRGSLGVMDAPERDYLGTFSLLLPWLSDLTAVWVDSRQDRGSLGAPGTISGGTMTLAKQKYSLEPFTGGEIFASPALKVFTTATL